MPNPAMAEVKLGVMMTNGPRCGCPRWSWSGSEATSRKAKEVAMARRATGLNSWRSKRW